MVERYLVEYKVLMTRKVKVHADSPTKAVQKAESDPCWLLNEKEEPKTFQLVSVKEDA